MDFWNSYTIFYINIGLSFVKFDHFSSNFQVYAPAKYFRV